MSRLHLVFLFVVIFFNSFSQVKLKQIVGFADELTKLGNQIDSTQRTYEEAMKKLKTGRGSLVTRARAMQKLGLSNTKTLNPKFTDTLEDDEESEQE